MDQSQAPQEQPTYQTDQPQGNSAISEVLDGFQASLQNSLQILNADFQNFEFDENEDARVEPSLQQQGQSNKEGDGKTDSDGKLKKIGDLRAKQIQLKKQLLKIQREEKQMLQELSPEQKQSAEFLLTEQNEINEYDGFFNYSKTIDNKEAEEGNSILPVLVKKPTRQREKKPIIAITREQFEAKVKNIAKNIRSQIKPNKLRYESEKKREIKNRSWSKSNDTSYFSTNSNYQNISFKLPSISNKTNKTTFTANFSDRKEFSFRKEDDDIIEEEMSMSKGEFENQKLQSKKKQQNISKKVVRSILRDIIKSAMKKAEYNEKYGVKFEPVEKKKYPVTAFRKKIFEESREKRKLLTNERNSKVSVLEQRKRMYEKSRINQNNSSIKNNPQEKF